jgi:hypothetical protein
MDELYLLCLDMQSFVCKQALILLEVPDKILNIGSYNHNEQEKLWLNLENLNTVIVHTNGNCAQGWANEYLRT